MRVTGGEVTYRQGQQLLQRHGAVVGIRGRPRCLVGIAPRRVGVDAAELASRQSLGTRVLRSSTVQVAFDVIAPTAGRLLCTCARSSRTDLGLPSVAIVSSHQSSQ